MVSAVTATTSSHYFWSWKRTIEFILFEFLMRANFDCVDESRGSSFLELALDGILMNSKFPPSK